MTSTIPVTVTPEAAARIAELGFEAHVETMLEYARQNIAGLVRLEVVLNERYDLGGEPGVAIDAWSERPFVPGDNTSRDLVGWLVDTFPPEVLEHLHMSYLPGAGHAG